MKLSKESGIVKKINKNDQDVFQNGTVKLIVLFQINYASKYN